MPKSKQRKKTKNAPSIKKSDSTEFSGFMGWMQKQQKWFYFGGIFFLILSLGSAIIFSFLPTPEPVDPVGLDQATTESAIDKESDLAEKNEVKIPLNKQIIRKYKSEPMMSIDESKSYTAVIETEKGNISIKLFAKDSPRYVNNFVFLAKNKFYDGLTFHRVIEGFVAQGGDPTGRGNGGPGYYLTRELNDLPLSTGTIAYAQSNLGVNGSQFFLAYRDVNSLKQQGFSTFGEIIDGMDVFMNLKVRDPNIVSAAAPAERIISIIITEE
jgi:cyclophilin family peptidyl-prolyl cis-trans isomerase